MKKIVKLAVLRSNDDKPCPFLGEQIPHACQNVGKLIQRMAPVSVMEHATEEEKALIIEANTKLFMWNNPQERCMYADKIMNNTANCMWEEEDEKMDEKGVPAASTYYYKLFNGMGIDGLYSSPISYMSESSNPYTKTMFSGTFNLEGSASEEDEDLTKKGIK